MQFLPKHPHVALAIATYLGFVSAASADTTPFDRQERGGLMLNVPFDSRGFQFKDTVISLVFQKAKVTSSTYGWQIALGSKLSAWSPVFAFSALGGDRCAQATVGVAYGNGQWGLPVGIQGPYVQVGLAHAESFSGWQAGLSSLGCFKRHLTPAPAPAVVAPPVAPAPPSSGSGSQQVANSVDRWIRSPVQAPDLDWA